MHVLLTGAAGFIGRRVHHALTARHHDVRRFDSLRADVHGVGPHDYDGTVGDVRDPAALDAALDGVDAVVHLAAKVGLGIGAHDMPDYADSNVTGTAQVLAAMARAGVERIVQASSMVVYGEGLGACAVHGAVAPGPRSPEQLERGSFEPPCPHCGRTLGHEVVPEGVPLDPRNAYAVSKVGQEQLAAAWARSTGGRAVSLRYHNVYGPGLPRDTPYAGVAAIFLSALLRGEAPRVFEDGGQRRDFVHVDDVAAATVAALEADVVSDSLVLNVGSGQPRTVGDLARALATVMDGPEPVLTGEYRLGDVRHIVADSSRARELLDWSPGTAFADGVADLALRPGGGRPGP